MSDNVVIPRFSLKEPKVEPNEKIYVLRGSERNKSCPCGSGKKSKHCCQYKIVPSYEKNPGNRWK